MPLRACSGGRWSWTRTHERLQSARHIAPSRDGWLKRLPNSSASSPRDPASVPARTMGDSNNENEENERSAGAV